MRPLKLRAVVAITLAPSGMLRGDIHGMDWKNNHRQPAQADPEYCATCHKQSWCQSCHNGVVRPLDLHGGDYVSRHSIEARRNQPDCGSCHRRQTFCLGCHERLGVVAVRRAHARARRRRISASIGRDGRWLAVRSRSTQR